MPSVASKKFEIGDTVTDLDNPEALATIAIDEPTLSMVSPSTILHSWEGRQVRHLASPEGALGQRA